MPLGLDQAPEQPMTPKMVTVYYRAPEILMGQTYALPSDVWSTGITFVEVEQGHPPFQIETEFKLVREIFKTVGGHVKNLELCTLSEAIRPQMGRNIWWRVPGIGGQHAAVLSS